MSKRFHYSKHSLTGNYVIKDKDNKIILPSTTSEVVARKTCEFLNSQEDKIHELTVKASSWERTAGEELSHACKHEAKLMVIKKKFDDKITEVENDLEVSVRGGAPTGAIHAELDLLYELKEELDL